MEELFVSIIIPNYNHAKFLHERLESIFNQTYKNYEVILLDDCSSDNSKDILLSYKDYPQVSHIVINEKNSGSPFVQWLKGIDLSKYEWIWIAESDDVADPLFLEKMISFTDEKTSFVFCKSNIIDQDGCPFSDTTVWLQDLSEEKWNTDFNVDGVEEFFNFIVYKNEVSNASSALFNKKKAQNIKHPITHFKTCGDWLFFAQMSLLGRIIYTSEPLNNWRLHPNTTRNINSLDYEYVRFREISEIIRFFDGVAQNYNRKLDYKKYRWVLYWLMSRYSYAHLLQKKYFFAPLPRKLKLSYYFHLFIRTIKEVYNSIISKANI